MRKVLYLFTLLGLLGITAKAQTPVTNAAGTTQNYGGINVTVADIAPTGTPAAFTPAGICGAGPYRPGITARNGFSYSFSQPITHVRLRFARLHAINPQAGTGEEIAIRINGAPYTLTNGNLSPFAGTCGLPFNASVSTGGYLTDIVTPIVGNVDGSGVEVNVALSTPPYVINSVEVEHLYTAPNMNGVIYELAFTDDTCTLPFVLTASDSTPCTGRCITLNAPKFPNTTYTWGDDGTPIPGLVTADSATRRVCNFSLLQTGKYWVTAQRGACIYTDSLYVQAYVTPPAPSGVTSKYPNGICQGADDTLTGVSQGGAGVEYVWYRRSGAPISGSTSNPHISPVGTVIIPGFDAGDQDIYCTYVHTTANPFDRCVSDTSCIPITMLPDVTADFDVIQQIAGCEGDTVYMQNKSLGATVGYFWRFFDTYSPVGLVTGSDASEIVRHVYPIPKPNNFTAARTYNIELVAINQGCRDSMIKQASFNHPLFVKYGIDKPEVCQGDLLDSVHFTDSTSDPVGGPHYYTWIFGTPNTLPSHLPKDTAFLYTRSSILEPNGTWKAKLIVQDYLGCLDSFETEIFVDSTGPIVFTATDTVVCAGQQIQFEGDLNRIGLEGSFWDFGGGNITPDTNKVVFNFDAPGRYVVSFNAQYRVCRDTYARKEILIKPFPQINLGPDSSMCPGGNPIQIFDRIAREPSSKIRWKWSTPSPKDTISGVWVRHPGVYSATVEMDGCSAADTVTIRRNCYLDIPNAFTPDGDGNNDYFLPRQLMSKSVSSFRMTVFNRWGQKVFETTSLNGRGWDGNFNNERQPQGVYPYLLEVSFSNRPGDMEKYEGNVTLLR